MKTSIAIWIISCAMACNDVWARPSDVTVPQLVANPQKFNEKTISTIGYYEAEHHGVYLCANAKTASRGASGSWRIYLDLDHTTLSSAALNRVRHGYVSVVGKFQYRDPKVTVSKDGTTGRVAAGFGWMNVLDKQITNITTFENVPPPRP